MNFHAIRAIYLFEMSRTARTLLQSIVSPVISTSLYFVVFGAAIGSRITEIEGVSYPRYRVWHPLDHVEHRYMKTPAGGDGVGSVFLIHEVLGRDPRYTVDVHTDVVRLDEGGFGPRPRVAGDAAGPCGAAAGRGAGPAGQGCMTAASL